MSAHEAQHRGFDLRLLVAYSAAGPLSGLQRQAGVSAKPHCHDVIFKTEEIMI